MKKLTFSYPAVITLVDDETITLTFPDLDFPAENIPDEALASLPDYAAERLGRFVAESLALEIDLPPATALVELPLQENQKALVVNIIES